MSVPDHFSYLLILSTGVFAGAVVQGLAGFAFSAVAGAILLHVLPPIEAVPLMMACSIAVQGASMVALRHSMQWRGNLVFMVGGVLGIPPALYLLHHVDTWIFRVGFGAFLALGLTTMVAVQAFMNMSVVLSLMPTKGIPLPFVSNGGSSLVINLLGGTYILS